jgi:hypothetical protein
MIHAADQGKQRDFVKSRGRFAKSTYSCGNAARIFGHLMAWLDMVATASAIAGGIVRLRVHSRHSF